MSLQDKYYARIQLWGRTKADWAAVNPVLRENEIGLEKDTRSFKVGDGSTPWNSLPYYIGRTIYSEKEDYIETRLLGEKIEIVDNSYGDSKESFKGVLTRTRLYL